MVNLINYDKAQTASVFVLILLQALRVGISWWLTQEPHKETR